MRLSEGPFLNFLALSQSLDSAGFPGFSGIFQTFLNFYGVPGVWEAFRKLPGADALHSDRIWAHIKPCGPHFVWILTPFREYMGMVKYYTNHAEGAQDTDDCTQSVHPQAQNNHIEQRKHSRAPVDAFFVQCGWSVPEDAHSACNHPCLVHPRRDLCIISPLPYIHYFARLTCKMSSLGPHEI